MVWLLRRQKSFYCGFTRQVRGNLLQIFDAKVGRGYPGRREASPDRQRWLDRPVLALRLNITQSLPESAPTRLAISSRHRKRILAGTIGCLYCRVAEGPY